MNRLYEQQFHHLREKSQQRDEVDVLYYELVHNLVLELTRRRHRESKPQDAARIAVEPDGLRRAARTGAGNRGPVPSGHRAVARAATDASAAPQDDRQQQPRPAPPPAPEPVQAQAPDRPSRVRRIRRVSRTLRAGAAAGGVAAAAVADARRARAWQQTARRRRLGQPKTRRPRRMATPRQMQRWTKTRTTISTMVRLKPGPTGTTPAKSRIPQRSEACSRRAALRRRHQRRRRAARPLRRRAPVAARRR